MMLPYREYQLPRPQTWSVNKGLLYSKGLIALYGMLMKR